MVAGTANLVEKKQPQKAKTSHPEDYRVDTERSCAKSADWTAPAVGTPTNSRSLFHRQTAVKHLRRLEASRRVIAVIRAARVVLSIDARGPSSPARSGLCRVGGFVPCRNWRSLALRCPCTPARRSRANVTHVTPNERALQKGQQFVFQTAGQLIDTPGGVTLSVTSRPLSIRVRSGFGPVSGRLNVENVGNWAGFEPVSD
jgi:hypothetical protein